LRRDLARLPDANLKCYQVRALSGLHRRRAPRAAARSGRRWRGGLGRLILGRAQAADVGVGIMGKERQAGHGLGRLTPGPAARAQAADVGVGIMGKEGRQAVNNSDYAVSQFRFLTRLLLLHGSLSAYRLSRLIKYSFYKNIAFGGMLFFFQFYCGFSGQARRPAAAPARAPSRAGRRAPA
jgi:hypothetical protein